MTNKYAQTRIFTSQQLISFSLNNSKTHSVFHYGCHPAKSISCWCALIVGLFFLVDCGMWFHAVWLSSDMKILAGLQYRTMTWLRNVVLCMWSFQKWWTRPAQAPISRRNQKCVAGQMIKADSTQQIVILLFCSEMIQHDFVLFESHIWFHV